MKHGSDLYLKAEISYVGTTTSDGAAGGTTLVCSDLANYADFDGNLVKLLGGSYAGQARGINGITTGGTVTVVTAFSGQIASGTVFVITSARAVPVSVAALQADVTVIKGLVDSAEGVGPYSYLDAGGEQDVYEDTATTRRHIRFEVSNRNMTQTGTFRVYRKVNGANYDLYTSQPVKVVAGSDRAWDVEFTTNQAWKITYEEDVNEGAARDIPYNVIIQQIE